jgi:hypothetical protein
MSVKVGRSRITFSVAGLKGVNMCSTDNKYCPGAAFRADPHGAAYGGRVEAAAAVESGDAT